MTYKLSQYFTLFLVIMLFSSCNEVTDIDEHQLQENKPEEIETVAPSNMSDFSSISVIQGTWQRVGSSGHGKDISIWDTPYLIGTDNRIYYFNGTSWIQEPGGGHGKMISSTENQLFLRGNNDKIYTKSKGSSSWVKIVDEKFRSISAFPSVNQTYVQTSTLGSVISGGGSIPYEFDDSGNIASYFPSDYAPKRSHNVSYFYVDEFVRTTNSEYYAFGPIYEQFPQCCKSLGEGIFKLTPGSSTWEEVGGKAKDIATGGPNNDIWIIGDNNRIYKRVNNEWHITNTGHGKRISVSSSGQPYIIGTNDRIYRFVKN